MNRKPALPTPRRRPTAHREHCPMSGKIRYRDAREATDALHTLTNQAALADELGGAHTIRVRRKYKCTACRGWHLTSQEAWTSNSDTQPEYAAAIAAEVPAARKHDPLLVALARSLGRPSNPDHCLAA
jgi:hypothetical protein